MAPDDIMREEFLVLKALKDMSNALSTEASDKSAIIKNDIPKHVMRGDKIDLIVQRWYLVSKFKATQPS